MTQSHRALIRPPSPRLAQGLITHIDRVAVDVELALEQWAGYVDALGAAGWQTVEVPAADDCPDSVFVEDTVVMVGDTAVLSRPGADQRKTEIIGTATTLAALGYPVERITVGTLDGGDVLKIGNRIYVGRTLRTSAAGIAEFRRICEPLGFTGNHLLLQLLAAGMTAYGVYVCYLMLRRPEDLAVEANHVSWAHMYRMMFVAQIGFALAYLL